MTPVRRLTWQGIMAGSPDAALHAALFAVEPSARFEVSLHDHDFYEMMLVTEGRGTHLVGGDVPLAPGDLLFLRPTDAHAIQVRPGDSLHWINIAFPAPAWRDFRTMARLDGNWDDAPYPLMTHLTGSRHAALHNRFEQTLRRAGRGAGAPPTRLDLCRFLADALGGWTEPDDTPLITNAPGWLTDACRRFLVAPDDLRDGLPALRACCPVSDAHLARTLKAATGQTPTAFINDLRLTRAAALLTTTARPIIEIADECGFGQLGYFYRLFGARYGQSPHAFRRAARHPVGG